MKEPSAKLTTEALKKYSDEFSKKNISKEILEADHRGLLGGIFKRTFERISKEIFPVFFKRNFKGIRGAHA